jgi:hypothetical protein
MSSTLPSAGGAGNMAPKPRASLDGDTIFQVGDEEQWSDGEMSDDEGRKLTRKISA